MSSDEEEDTSEFDEERNGENLGASGLLQRMSRESMALVVEELDEADGGQARDCS